MYDYQVQACNDFGCSGWTGFAQVCVGTSSRSVEAVTTVTYYHTDALGSPVKETNSTGTVVKTSRYEPYGAPAAGNYENGPGYTGHATDSLTRLSYMQQRYYDPRIGRFLSIDPVRVDAKNGSNFNRYWYASNSPYKYIDPDGRAVALSGSDENKKDFSSLAFRTTGYKVSERNGNLVLNGQRDTKIGFAAAAKALSEAVKSDKTISINLVNNEGRTFGDSARTMNFDIADFNVFSAESETFSTAMFTHVLIERKLMAEGSGWDNAHGTAGRIESESFFGAASREMPPPQVKYSPITTTYYSKDGLPIKSFSFYLNDNLEVRRFSKEPN